MRGIGQAKPGSWRFSGLIAAAAAAFALTLAPDARGAAGVLDPGFGSGGFAIIDEPALFNEQLTDVVILPDGKILGAGSRGGSSGFLLARVNADGTPDAGFGPGGIRIEPYAGLGAIGSPRSIADIELTPDGKVVGAGLNEGNKMNALGFARFLANGTLDPSFGTAGVTTIQVTPYGDASAVAVAPDQKVVAAGDGGDEAVIARVDATGLPDGTFGPGGYRYVDVPGTAGEEAHAVRVLADGTVLAGGGSGKGGFLVELDSAGNPVAGFGTAGIAVHDLGTGSSASGSIEDLQLLPDGRILAAGRSSSLEGETQLFVARFTASGDLDPGFGSGGVFLADPTEKEERGEALQVLPDGRILVAGQRGGDGGEFGDTWLVRLTADGQPDPTFGNGGEAFASAATAADGASGLALQPDGAAVIGGVVQTESGLQLLFGRFSGDDPVAEPIAQKTFRCKGRIATIVGTKKADRLVGTRRADVIVGLGGNDRIIARGGNDVVCAGAGKDVVKGGDGRDLLIGNAGPDLLQGGRARDLLLGQAGVDRLFGNKGNGDRLFGGAKNDRLYGGAGKRDLCNGGAGKRDRAARSCERKRLIP